ncbi:uncharacterized protein [Diabrotica undecimpunctata]|uniref:uncharacterized protein n=1 Tax=Diabrotica undecimpunctata TaxID=50387 RepID=UPI003B636A8A
MVEQRNRSTVEEKKQAYIRWLSSKQQKYRDEYLELKRITRRTTVKAKREMWDKKCQEINTYLGGRKWTETWKFLSKIRTNKRKSTNIQLISTQNLEKYYGELLTENRDEYLTQSPTEVNIEGEDITIQVIEIGKAIKELKNIRSPGPGDIPAELIKCGSQKLFETVTWCINQFINGSPVPDEWKIAYISSIHKKGDKLK